MQVQAGLKACKLFLQLSASMASMPSESTAKKRPTIHVSTPSENTESITSEREHVGVDRSLHPHLPTFTLTLPKSSSMGFYLGIFFSFFETQSVTGLKKN